MKRKQNLDEDKEFLRTIVKTVLPHQYKTLAERNFTQCLAYFFSIVLLGFFTLIVLLLPQLLYLPSFVGNNTDKLTTFSIDFNIETSEPIIFLEKNPFVVIDTTGNITLAGNEGISYIAKFGNERRNPPQTEATLQGIAELATQFYPPIGAAWAERMKNRRVKRGFGLFRNRR